MKSSFAVAEIFSYKDGFVLSGRCIEGGIRIGDVFLKSVKVTEVSDDDHSSMLHKDVLGELNLTVVEIQYFRNAVTELRESQAGGLYVQGSGAQFIQIGCEVE